MTKAKYKHLDLFSGIGGFSIAAEMILGKDNVDHVFCDNDTFSQAILKKHWPNAPIYADIKTLTAERIAADTANGRRRGTAGTQDEEGHEAQSIKPGKLARRPQRPHSGIDLLTGGFPCQPFSSAGRRRGTEDDRHLWPHMLRLIRETRPHFILGENVGGLVTWNNGMVLDQIIADLEAESYEVGAFIIPAVSVNAPHRRDRVWIVAHAISGKAGRAAGDASDPSSSTRQRSWENAEGYGRKRSGTGREGGNPWNEDWPAVAARLCTFYDGLPDGSPRPRGWRNAALKGAGNAIVPHVAAEVMRAMISDCLCNL